MMIIHRYLLRQFLQVFVICFFSLMGLYVVIDAFANLDEFIHYGEKYGGLLTAVVRYYGPRSLTFFDSTGGIVALISAMFTLSTFQRFNELTALLAAGIPKWRIIKPIIVASGLIALAGVVNRELLIPFNRELLCRDVHDLAGDRARDFQNLLRDRATGVMMNGKQTLAKTQQIVQPNFSPAQVWDAPFKQIQAAAAYYTPADPAHNRPAGYWFKGVSAPKDIAHRPSLPKEGQHVLLTPLDYPWLKADECFIVSDITFDQLEGNDNWRRLSSTLGLIDAYRNPSLQQTTDMAVTIHGRMVAPLMDMTLLLLGLPLILRRYSRNIFLAIGQCVAVVVGFFMVNYAAQYLASMGIGVSADMAAWLPLAIFVPLATAISEPLRE